MTTWLTITIRVYLRFHFVFECTDPSVSKGICKYVCVEGRTLLAHCSVHDVFTECTTLYKYTLPHCFFADIFIVEAIGMLGRASPIIVCIIYFSWWLYCRLCLLTECHDVCRKSRSSFLVLNFFLTSSGTASPCAGKSDVTSLRFSENYLRTDRRSARALVYLSFEQFYIFPENFKTVPYVPSMTLDLWHDFQGYVQRNVGSVSFQRMKLPNFGIFTGDMDR